MDIHFVSFWTKAMYQPNCYNWDSTPKKPTRTKLLGQPHVRTLKILVWCCHLTSQISPTMIAQGGFNIVGGLPSRNETNCMFWHGLALKGQCSQSPIYFYYMHVTLLPCILRSITLIWLLLVLSYLILLGFIRLKFLCICKCM